MNLIYGVIGTYALSNCSGSSLAKKQFFIKSPRPSFLIKRAALGNLKASFHCTHWHRFFPLKRAFSKTYPSFLTLKEGSTSHLGLLPSGKKRETALLGVQNRYALRLADQSGLRHVVRDGTALLQLASGLRHLVRDGPPGNSSLQFTVNRLQLISWLFADNLQISC